jgi:hypothetical protein
MTGGIAPQDRTPLPPSLVEVPDGLLNLPGGYFGDSASVTDLVAVVEHGHAPDGAARALDVLGISPVVVRRDLSNAQAVKPVAATDDLVDRLERSGPFEPLVDHGVAVLFRVRDVQAGPSTHHPVAGPADAEGGVTAAVIAIDDTDPELTVEHQSTEIRLSAEDQTACIDAPLPLAVPSVLELEIDCPERPGGYCLWSEVAERCLHRQRFTSDPQPAAVALPVDPSDEARLFLYAGADSEPAQVTYRDVRMRHLTPGESQNLPTRVGHERLDLGAAVTRWWPVPARPSRIGSARRAMSATATVGAGTDP